MFCGMLGNQVKFYKNFWFQEMIQIFEISQHFLKADLKSKSK